MEKATHVHWSSFKIKKVVRTVAAKALLLSEELFVAMYLNKLVQELLFHDGKQLNITASTDSINLYNAGHTLK